MKKELREKGFSFWKIADVLITMKVSTKIRKGSWHARTVQAIFVEKWMNFFSNKNSKSDMEGA